MLMIKLKTALLLGIVSGLLVNEAVVAPRIAAAQGDAPMTSGDRASPPQKSEKKPQPEAWKSESLGLELVPVKADAVKPFDDQFQGGLRVIAIEAKGAAAKAGLKKGDILVGLHKWETLNVDCVQYVLDHPHLATFNPLTFTIVRSGHVRKGQMKISGEDPVPAPAEEKAVSPPVPVGSQPSPPEDDAFVPKTKTGSDNRTPAKPDPLVGPDTKLGSRATIHIQVVIETVNPGSPAITASSRTAGVIDGKPKALRLENLSVSKTAKIRADGKALALTDLAPGTHARLELDGRESTLTVVGIEVLEQPW